MLFIESINDLTCPFLISAYNPRTKGYKNAAFDILFDCEASQGQIFADCGVPGMIKQVVEVSPTLAPLSPLTMFSLQLAIGLQFYHFCLRSNRFRKDLQYGRL